MRDHLERLLHLILAGELERADAEIRRAAVDVAASLLTSEGPLGIEYIKTVAEISGDASSLQTLDFLVEKIAERGHLNQIDIDYIYAQTPASRWL